MNARQKDDWTPLGTSAANGHLGIVKLLIERGADIHAPNGHGLTPYQLSLREGHRKVADLLRKHGADKARFVGILL